MTRRTLLACGVASSVLYIVVDVLGTLMYPGYRYTQQQFSELTAVGSPVRLFMIALNTIPYTLLGLFGALASSQVGQMVANEPTPWMGVQERINIYATMLWIAVLAVGILRTDHSGGPSK